MHLNCRGLSSNWEKFQDLLCDMHSDEFSFDYIVFSEVFRCDRDQRISLPGYHPFITRCREINDDNRGGVGLFVRESMDYKIRDDLSVFIPHVYESLFIELLPKNGQAYNNRCNIQAKYICNELGCVCLGPISHNNEQTQSVKV